MNSRPLFLLALLLLPACQSQEAKKQAEAADLHKCADWASAMVEQHALSLKTTADRDQAYFDRVDSCMEREGYDRSSPRRDFF
jgi:hypothetical protein